VDLDALWDFGDPATSEQRFRAALADADGEDAAVLRTQLARALALQRQFAEADAMLSTVDPGDSALAAGYLDIERGRVRNSGGDPDAARPCFISALERAEAAGLDFLAADAAHMLAITETGEAQVPWAERALRIAQASDDPRARRWAGSVTHNLGWTMHDLERYDDALRYFEQALALRVAQGDPELIAVARWTIARCLRSLGRYDEALAIQRELRQSGPGDGYIDEELGELLLITSNLEAAAPHFATAHRLLSTDPWLTAEQPERLHRLAELAADEQARVFSVEDPR
jgi:tetratricopeptide (TPR) repeat protein